jgi:hypothetical protein
MQRRKIVVGLGSLAAGGAAAMGTGAFSFMQTDRHVPLEVVNDSQAFLAFQRGDENREYSQITSDGKIRFNLDSNANVGGSGVNPDSVYLFDDVARILNQGGQEVELKVPDTTSNGFWSTNFVAYVGDGTGESAGTRQSIWPKDGKTDSFNDRLNDRTNVDDLDDLINLNPSSVTIPAGHSEKFGVAIAAPSSAGASKSTGITFRAEET